MIETPTYLRNFERVVDAYGYWPSFHDSPVLRFSHDNNSIELEVEAWEMTSETDHEGYFKLVKKHRIGFRFSDVTSAELDDFIPDNILFGLGFSSIAERDSNGHFFVDLDSAMGGDLCGRFTAESGEVIEVTPLVELPETKTEQGAAPKP